MYLCANSQYLNRETKGLPFSPISEAYVSPSLPIFAAFLLNFRPILAKEMLEKERVQNLHLPVSVLFTQNPEIPPTHFFAKFARTSAYFAVTWVRNPAKVVQKYLFR